MISEHGRNMRAIGVPTAQQTTVGSKSVTVGILDTGTTSAVLLLTLPTGSPHHATVGFLLRSVALLRPMYAAHDRGPHIEGRSFRRMLTLQESSAGIDYTHPDLKDQIDHSQSASCVGGKLNTTQAAYRDTFGHGTCVRLEQRPVAQNC